MGEEWARHRSVASALRNRGGARCGNGGGGSDVGVVRRAPLPLAGAGAGAPALQLQLQASRMRFAEPLGGPRGGGVGPLAPGH
jgi:hypothetical protein